MHSGMHTCSLYHHGVAEDWAGFKLPWDRQMTFIELMDYTLELGLEGLHLDAKALDQPILDSFLADNKSENFVYNDCSNPLT
jgi:hypothetical protein